MTTYMVHIGLYKYLVKNTSYYSFFFRQESLVQINAISREKNISKNIVKNRYVVGCITSVAFTCQS